LTDTEQEIFELAKTYFGLMELATQDQEFPDKFIQLLVDSVFDMYKKLRNYPPEYTREMIDADVYRYFYTHKTYIAAQVIPELYGRVGAEGLAMLTDASTTRMWKNSDILTDVVPIAQVV